MTSSYILGVDRDQLTLMPEFIEDYVSADNPVRLFDSFVDSLDLDNQFRLEDGPGRPAYDPKDMLKLYLWDTLTA